MAPTILIDDGVETRLQQFLAGQPRAHQQVLRTLAHAWTTVGAPLAVGARVARLLVRDAPPVTAATLYVDLGGSGPVLEVGRVVLEQHGVPPAAWDAWCDTHAELAAHGFDRHAKYPRATLAGMDERTVLRTALGLRDLYLAARPAVAA